MLLMNALDQVVQAIFLMKFAIVILSVFTKDNVAQILNIF